MCKDHPKIFEKTELDSPKELLRAISPLLNNGKLRDYIFRGHGNSEYKLIPKALRLDQRAKLQVASGLGAPIGNQIEWTHWQIEIENYALRRFYRLSDRLGLYIPNAPTLRRTINSFFDLEAATLRGPQRWLPEEYLEIAGLAQHYGLPTRLLDWSYDPLTGC
ncbi:FRG domain-containing protein [Rhodovulum sp. ES.010]|uniref:FRG domain-containing protein n=1 Tax=Rhodovulum sp. ES.010 TaxID=1882821 RepID=UPI00092B9FD7|nr:FRG domain-containing protein [Rhodovulum sp. ES.010]